MSATITASHKESAYRIWKRVDLRARVTRNPSCTVISSGSRRSSQGTMPARDLMSMVASATGSAVPSARKPVNQVPPSQRSAAQPVTPPCPGRSAPASRIRCSTSVASTHDGT